MALNDARAAFEQPKFALETEQAASEKLRVASAAGSENAFQKMKDIAPDAFFAALGTENFFKVIHQPMMPYAHGVPDTTIDSGDEKGTQIWHKTTNGHKEVVQVRLATGAVYDFKYDKQGAIKQMSGPEGRLERKETDQWARRELNDIGKSKTRFDGTINQSMLDLGVIKLEGKDGSKIINGNGYVCETTKSDSGDTELLQSVTNSRGRKVEFNYLGGQLNSIQLSDSSGTKFVLVRNPENDKWYQTIPQAPNAMFELPYKVQILPNASVSIDNSSAGTKTTFSNTGIRTERTINVENRKEPA
jgi:hypothetical protein